MEKSRTGLSEREKTRAIDASLSRVFLVGPLLGVALAAAAPVSAAPSKASPELRACAAEKDPEKRLACYDREMGAKAASEAGASPPAEAPSAAAHTTPPPTEAQFGYRGSIAREEIDRRKAASESIDRLEATVVEVATRPRGELVLTLDNGQVWAQKMADSTRIKPGDRVVIRKGSLGSFLLVAPNKRSTRVIREK